MHFPLSYSIDDTFDLERIEVPFRKIFELAVPYLKTRLNLPHTYIVYQFAQLILQEEGLLVHTSRVVPPIWLP